MAKQPSSSGKILAFDAARVRPAARPQAVANGKPRSGYLEAWLKNHDDSQSLIRENLSLKDRQQRLEDTYRAQTPSLGDHLVYYISVLLALGVLFGLMMLAD